jgi:hypothetical protein
VRGAVAHGRAAPMIDPPPIRAAPTIAPARVIARLQ